MYGRERRSTTGGRALTKAKAASHPLGGAPSRRSDADAQCTTEPPWTTTVSPVMKGLSSKGEEQLRADQVAVPTVLYHSLGWRHRPQ